MRGRARGGWRLDRFRGSRSHRIANDLHRYLIRYPQHVSALHKCDKLPGANERSLEHNNKRNLQRYLPERRRNMFVVLIGTSGSARRLHSSSRR